MNKEQVTAKIGKENWKDFQKFMKGQTVGFDKGGEIDYYECDVSKFACNIDTFASLGADE